MSGCDSGRKQRLSLDFFASAVYKFRSLPNPSATPNTTMGKKPYSAKAKREQLRQKRLASTSTSPATSAPSPSTLPTVSASNAPPSSPAAPPRRARGRAPKRSNAQRYRLQLGDADTNRSEQRSLAHTPLETLPSYEASVRDVRPYPDIRFTMPRRPAWRYDDSVTVLDKREKASFDAWLKQINSSDQRSAFFEHNLETWRQLWRVIERSDVLVIVADIRFPALHFVPDLYHYVSDTLGKGVVLALNKCDLVPAHLLSAWQRYFTETYPNLAIAMFSSFPDAKLAPSKHNSELLSKRERRMARSKLSAWGADQLLAAIDSLDIDPKKRAYLEVWRARLDAGVSSADEHALRDADYTLRSLSLSQDTPFEKESTPPETPHEVDQRKKQRKRRRAKTKQIVINDGFDSEREKEDVHFPETNSQISDANVEIEEDHIRENMITIGVVGHPNSGKSTMINGVFRKKVVSTSRTPGHTKHLQTIFLSDSVRLCDCPGLVFPGLVPRELQILAGMFPISQVREPYGAVKYLAERVPLVDLLSLEMEVPRLEEFTEENGYLRTGWTAWKICEAWAMKRGFRTAKAARLDVFRAANSILRLALDGRIVLATVPRGYVKPECIEREESDNLMSMVKDAQLTELGMKAKSIGEGSAKDGDSEDDIAASEDSNKSAESADEEYEESGFGNAFCVLADE